MLEVLPPEKWKHLGGVEIFRMMEYYTENITAHFIHLKDCFGEDRYLECFRRTTVDYAEIASEAHRFVLTYRKGEWHPSWTAIMHPIKELNPLNCSVISFLDDSNEYHDFNVFLCDHNAYKRIVFGGCCNIGFLESGFIEFDYTESIGEVLQELLSDLEAYYNDGPKHVSRIVCNERM